MDIHNILKQHFDKNETYESLPRQVKLSYIEIDLYEKNKIKKMLENKEKNEKIKTLSPLEIKEQFKKEYSKIGGNVNNKYGFYAYYRFLHILNLDKNINSLDLYKNINDENLFIYIYNHVKKYSSFNGKDDNKLLDLFIKYIFDDDLNILLYIFDRGEKIFTHDFKKKCRTDRNYVIKIKNEYYILFDNHFCNFTKNSFVLKKLIPIQYKNIVIYHYTQHENERISFINTNEIYENDINKKIHIELFNDFYCILN